MPARISAPGAPCWIDLQTSDVESVRAFYPALFGWTAGEASPDFGGYFMFLDGDRPVAGAMRADDQAPVPNVWSIYLQVDDAEKTIDLAGSHGGQVIVPAMPIATLGSMGFVVDAAGAGIGLWQAGDFPGFITVAEAGHPAWFEGYTRDLDTSSAFYRDVFGWNVQVGGDADNRMAALVGPDGEGPLAGVVARAAELGDRPAHWVVYFGVEDVPATCARAVALGGAVLEGPEDAPWGAVATLADPQGALFKIVDVRGPSQA